jgi:hypothetical protein
VPAGVFPMAAKSGMPATRTDHSEADDVRDLRAASAAIDLGLSAAPVWFAG